MAERLAGHAQRRTAVGIQPGYNHFGTMHLINSKKGILFVADTLINRHPDEQTLYDIARLSASTVRFFNRTPTIAMLSYSNFGTDTEGSAERVQHVIERMHREYPDLAIDGEMQLNFAMDKELRDEKYPFNMLKGMDVNTCLNHLKVNGKNLYPQVGNNEPIGTHIYIKITKRAMVAQKSVRGIFTLLSSISILALEAFPVRVAAVFFSKTYFWTANIPSVIISNTTAIAAAPGLS